MIKEYTVDTPCGSIRGVPGRTEGTAVFKGIRYAEAKRFAYPRQVKSWEGVYAADRFGDCSIQPRTFYIEEDMPGKVFYYREFRKGETYSYSEDCLFLNIWAPLDAHDAPVLFYIHGGGFQGGCGHEKHFSGEAYCEQGVILVTCNYRLGAFGFCTLPSLEKEAGHTGNYGLYDQMCAMQWVKDNIGAFGGDPDRITIMGQSAGAMSVQQHCVSPLSEGLFGQAIMLSGGGVSKLLTAGNAADGYAFWEAVAGKAGCGQEPEALRRVEAKKFFQARDAVAKEWKGARKFMGPVIDGALLPGSALDMAKAGEQRNIPYMVSSTSEDMMPPILFHMGMKWALLQARQGKCKSYVSFFDRQLPGDDRGAWHSSDLWYAFGTLDNGWRPFTEWDRQLSDAMVKYIAGFVKKGDPNGGELPVWEPVAKGQRKVMRFGDSGIRMGGVNRWKLIHTMLTKPNVGE